MGPGGDFAVPCALFLSAAGFVWSLVRSLEQGLGGRRDLLFLAALALGG
jgi:hypothetical protein